MSKGVHVCSLSSFNFFFRYNMFQKITERMKTRCLKMTEKVSFSIASEASYVNILSGQKFIKIAKNALFGEFLKKIKLAVKQSYQTGQF